MFKVGDLIVKLGLDTSSIGPAMKKFEAFIQASGARAIKIAKYAAVGITTALVAGFGGVALAMRSTIDRMDLLAKMGQRLGLPVEQLSKWSHAADLAGTSLEEMAVSMRRLSANMDDAQEEGSMAQIAFSRLGLSVKDASGKLKTGEQIMLEVADKFHGMQDGAIKSALAMDIFGRSGVSMIPMLNEGSAALKETFVEAQKLGMVFSGPAAHAAEQINDNIDRLHGAFSGIITQITEQMVPGIAKMTDGMVAWAKETDVANTVGKALGDWLGDLPAKMEEWVMRINRVRSILALLNTDIRDVNAAWAAIPSRADFEKSIEALYNRLPTLDMNAISSIPGDIADAEAKRAAEDAAAAAEVQADAAKAAQEAMQKHIDTVLAQKEALESAGQAMYEATRGPFQEYADKIAEITRLEDAGAISSQVAGRAHLAAAKMVADQYLSTASVVTNALGSIFENNKGVAVASAIINTLQGITQALTLPFPLNWAQAAAVTAAGFAQVAKIKSTTSDGKGAGGSSSAISTASASSARSGSSDNRDTSGDRVLSVHGVNPSMLYSGESVRGLADALVQWQKDGGRVVFSS